jgi:hypothetical protein
LADLQVDFKSWNPTLYKTHNSLDTIADVSLMNRTKYSIGTEELFIKERE